jgi:hypothetical protein
MWRLLRGAFALPVILILIASANDVPVTRWAIVNCLFYPVVAFVSIALHEAGHALVALAVGLRVPRVEIGLGRRVGRFRWQRVAILLNAFPSIGKTYVGADEGGRRGLRARLWLTIAAGPLVTAGILALALAWPKRLPLEVVTFPIVQVAGRFAGRELLAFANLWMLALNLLPFPFIRAAGLFYNDGALLLALPFRSDRMLREVLVAAAVLEAEDKREHGDFDGAEKQLEEALGRVPGSWSIRSSLAVVFLSRRKYADARVIFEELMREEPPSRSMRLVIENNLAWTYFLMRSEELKSEADRLAAGVHKKLRRAGWAMGTRGAVLLWKGELLDAKILLERAYGTNSAPESRAFNACCLAMTMARLDRIKEARVWLDRARANHATCPLLDEAEAATRAGPSFTRVDPALGDDR